ncbi:MAG: TonB-dependent receptor [Thermoanaerobaculia bacterium]
MRRSTSFVRSSAFPLALTLLCLLAPWATSAQATGTTQGELQEEPADTQASTDPASSQDDDPGNRERLRVFERIEVRERADDLVGVADAASEGTTGAADLARRPILRAGELVETVPGLIATQHSGGGKANQYFVRGFNLDHGTDLAISVAGVPVNMPTHGHGQGYADLSFLIPELVDRIAFRKGTYAAEDGDFSAAGAASIDLVRSLPEGFVELTGGGNGFRRALVAESLPVGGGDLVAALDAGTYDGPWRRGDDFDRASGLVRYSHGDASRGLSVTALGYDGEWLSTDQVPRRAVESGRIDRFGLLDPGPRGSAERYSLSAEAHRGGDRTLSRVGGYLLHNDFGLVSNFTYFLDDPVNGDQFEQADRRRVGGIEASHWRLTTWAGRPVETTVGFEARHDAIDNGLYRTRELERLATVREDEVSQWTGGAYAEASVRWHPKIRSVLGVRAEGYTADVESDQPVNSGSRDDSLLAPKASFAFGPWRGTELYLSWGRGFHSNDARGATIRVDPASGEPVPRVDPLVVAEGTEIGVRTATLPGLQSTLAVFTLELDSELVFVGDGGATEASRPSRRVGVEWTNHYRPRPWLALELDAAVTGARFADDDPAGEEIPGALEHVISAGVGIDGTGRWSGGLRLRYFGGYPLIEDDSVRAGSTALLNTRLAWRLSDRLTLTLSAFNLLDREDSDVEYFYASRLPGEPTGGIEDVHFHPVEKPSARLSARWRF